MDPLLENLQARTVFKLIIGITNFEVDNVRFLAQVYTLAGADIIDVAARPDIVAATSEAISTIQKQFPDIPRPKIMVSLGLEGDPHVGKARIDLGVCRSSRQCLAVCPEHCIGSNRIVDYERCTACGLCLDVCPEHAIAIAPAHSSDLAAQVTAGLAAGAEMVELHASDSEDRPLQEAVHTLSTVLNGRYLSVCLGAEGLRSPENIIRQAWQIREIHGPSTMIQAEGLTLYQDGSRASSLQGLALAQALLAKTSAYILVAGGANYWTRDLADMIGIPVHGIASGSYGRNLVNGFKATGKAGDLWAAAARARRFISHAKGISHHDV